MVVQIKKNLSMHGLSVPGGVIAYESRCWLLQSLVIALYSPVGFRRVSSLLCVSSVGFRGFMMIS